MGGGKPDKSARGEKAKDLLLFLPRLILLLKRLAIDPEVSRTDKILVLGALAYVASPIDLVPDFIPVLGEVDDIYVLALVILRLVRRSGPERVRAAWDGPEDIVAIVERVIALATAFLPARLTRMILGAVEREDLSGLK